MIEKPNSQVVMVIDDDEAVLRSLASVLQTYGYEVITFVSARDALSALKRKGLVCIVLDVRMPEVDGLAAQRLLQQSGSNLPLIFITAHGDVATAVTAMKAGAADFIEKPIDDERLAASIKSAVGSQNQKANTPDVVELKSRFTTLTPREKLISKMVLEGYSTAAIAATLAISARTVDHHRASVLAKMQATSLSQLLRYLMLLTT